MRFGISIICLSLNFHEIWYNEETDKYTTIPNHPGDMPEGTLKAILKQAGIKPDLFLKKKK